MTLAHLSHYGLEHVATTSTNVVLSGSLSACKRMAAAHGMEVAGYEGRLISSNCGHAVYAPADEVKPNRIVYRGGGMVQRCRDDYSLVMPLKTWLND